jgi:hypothetical protein
MKRFLFSTSFQRRTDEVSSRVARWFIHFHTKKSNLGTFWRVLE